MLCEHLDKVFFSAHTHTHNTHMHTHMHTHTHTHLQLIFVNFRYGSPRPKAAVLETSTDGGVTFRPIQYYADDCMLYFGLPNNGRIVNANDANCITTTSM